ncbi:MAG: putative Ig domain-containing protein [Sphingorhabdus sp.]
MKFRSWAKMAAAIFSVLAAQLILSSPVSAQHTSGECPPQTATVSAGGTVSIDISDCELPGFGGIGAIDGGSTGAANFEDHGTATTRRTPGGQWILDYAHNGSTGIGSTDVFELSDGSLAGIGDIQFTITINASASPITVTPGSLPTLTAGVAFSQALTASGGLAPYTFTLQSGVLPPGLSLSSGGVLSGTPTQRGAYSFSVRATDSTTPTAQFVDKGYTGTVQNPTLTLTTGSGTAIQSSPFSQTLSTSGGVAPYIYQLETGSFPAGISVSSAGVVSGTTTAAPGSYPVTLRVTDSSTGPGIWFELENYTLTVSPPPPVTISVSPASVNEDGVTNITYTVSRAAATPSPLTVNLTYSGTATSGSDYTGASSTVVIPANATSASLTLDPVADTTSEANETIIVSIAAGTGYSIGSPSSATATITNDEGTSTFCPTLLATVAWGGSVSINAGSCNAGFGLGVVLTQPTHGTATVGAFGANQPIIYTHNGTSGTTDTFTVNDGEAPPNNQIRVNVTITPPTSSIVVSPSALSPISAGTPFSQTLTASGGTGPYAYTVVGGTIPPGLSLSSGGTISGTATQRGAYNFTVRAQDSLGAFTDKGYSGTVAVPTLTITPASATGIQNVPYSQTIVASGGIAPYSFLHEVAGGALPAGMSLSSTGVLSGTPTTVGTTNFQIRVTDSSTGTGSYFELESFSFTVSPPPSVSIAVSPASVSEDGATNLTYTVTRSLNLTSPTTVNITTAGTATSGVDYTGAVATVTIPAGATTATFTIDPTVDGTVEPDETVTMIVAAGTGYTVGVPASATGTILNDDVPSATISVSPVNVAEDGAPNLVYTVTLNQASFGALSLGYTIGGTATNGTDYATIASPLVIPAGNTTGTITVNPTADATIETSETVTLTLNAGAGYTVGVPNSATGTILNDDLPNLAINDVTANEGNAGTTNFTFTVSLSAPAGPGGVTFDIATANGTATGGVDYVTNALTGQTIPTGSSTYTFTVQANGDVLNEPSETFFVNVTNVVNAVVVDGQGVGTIVNDDPLPSLSINDVTVTEGNAGTINAVFTATLSAASGQTVTVNYATADGTATQPADYTNTSGSLTFTPGQTTRTITVPVIGETVPEANETFFVNLSGATNATISDNQGVGTITNDDVPVTISPASMPNGAVGAAYSQTLTGSGGTGPYSFSVTAGSLPAGLSLSSGGVLSGTPTAGGTFNFTVTGTDSSAFPGPFSGSQAYALTIAPATIALPATSLAGGTLGTAYSASITPASGGTSPYSYAVTAGALPGGLTLNTATGAITGTPGALGTFNFSITATDSSTGTGPYTATQAYSILVVDQPPVPSASSITLAYNAAATNVPLSISGGAATSLTIATPPANGTALVSGTTITYQPTTGYAGPDSFAYTATNSGGTSAPATISVTVQDPVITITPSGGFSTTIAAPYTQTFTFNGGAQPWSGFQVTNMPAGLSITGSTANTVTISGTPSAAGSFNLNVSAADSSTGNGPFNVGQAFTLTVNGPTLAMTPAPGTLTAPYGAPYSQAFTATGGTGPFTYAVTGALPAGLSFSGGTVSGTPTVPGSYPITVTATDTGSTGAGAPFSIAQNYTINVPAPTINVSPASLPNPVAATAYSQTITASGGAGTNSFAVTAGSLPPGITLASSGALSGTSNQVGTYNFTVTATDGFGQTGSRAYSVTIAAPVLTMTPAPGTLNAPYGAAFSRAFTANGGSGNYSYALTGTLPSGLNFSGGTISGIPTVPGSYPITVTATDTTITGVGAPFSIAQNYTIDVPAPTIVVSPAALPNPALGSAYNQLLSATGGAVSYNFAVTSGSLPSGISLDNAGTLSGTSYEAGTFNFTVTATDGYGQTGNRSYAITIAAPVLTMMPSAGGLNAPYGGAFSQTFSASGGTGNYSYAVTGTLPAGLSFSGNTIAGTATVPGSYAITVTATDLTATGVGAPFTIAQNYTINIAAPTISVTPASLGAATVGTAFSQSLTASGGVGPYTFAITAGTLPTGVSLSGGNLSGTPTAAGSFTITITATDANGQSGSQAYTLNVAAPTLVIAPASGALPISYATPFSRIFAASGGVGPYSYALGGTLPSGLTFNAATATVSGTPTVAGNFAFTVTATDTGSTGAGAPFSVQGSYTLAIAAPTIAVTPATLPNATAGTAYSATLAGSGAVAPYNFSLASGTLPAGVTLSGGGLLAGTPTASGNFPFSVTVRDANGQTGTASLVLAVNVPSLTITPATLPTATQGVAYNQTVSASGGIAPYSFTVSSGTLPAGLALNATSGAITGTPTGSGVVNFAITVTDSTAGTRATATITYALNIVARPDPATDREVRGLVQAQVLASRRFADAQVNNFMRRLESLHGQSSGGGGFQNGLRISSRGYCEDSLTAWTNGMCTKGESKLGPVAAAGGDDAGDGSGTGGSNAKGGDLPWTVWAGGTIRFGDRDPATGRLSQEFESEGISLGVDRRFSPSFAAGIGVGLGRDTVDIGDNGSRSQGEAKTIAIYGSHQLGSGIYVDWLGGYQWLDFDLRRYVTTTGALINSNRSGRQWFVTGTAGADIETGNWMITPYVRIDLTRGRLNGYTENSGTLFDLTFLDQDVDFTSLGLGTRVNYEHRFRGGTLLPRLRLEYLYDTERNGDALVAYRDLTSGPFSSISLAGLAREQLMLGLGSELLLGEAFKFEVEYLNRIASGSGSDQAVQMGVSIKF